MTPSRAILLGSLFTLGAVACSGNGQIGGDLLLETGSPDETGITIDAGDTGLTTDGDPPPPAEESKKVGGPGAPFDPKEGGSSGVKLGPAGEIVLDPTDYGAATSPLIWVANSVEGTISKIDTRKMKELARYRTGPGSPDPSRTTVALTGDVVVANRGGASATKIAANPVDCTGPGTGTSASGTDVRAWGDDKCVIWNTTFPAGSLTRAAAFDAEKGLDGAISTSVWIGLWTSSQMLRLDSKTGKILATVDVAPVKPYGAAIDKDHNVWVWGGGVGKIDIKTLGWSMVPMTPGAYGIAVDPKGRVWTSGGNVVARYTPTLGKWDSINVGASNRGLGVDAKGSVWIADTEFGVHQVDSESMAVIKSLDVPATTGKNYVGIAIDFDGYPWTVNYSSSAATKIDPKTYDMTPIKVGTNPYTYSDMTGFQLRNAAAPFGKYRHVFAGCGDTAVWKRLNWTASLPTGTQVEVRARIANDPTALAAAPWKLIARQPPDAPPIDFALAFGDAAKGGFLEVEFMLSSTAPTVTPILSSIEATASCPPKVS